MRHAGTLVPLCLGLLLVTLGCDDSGDAGGADGAGGDDTGAGEVGICEVAAEDELGWSSLAGQRVTVEGVVLVDGGALANKKLRTHLQAGDCGLALFAAEDVYADLVDALGPIVRGDTLRVTGLVSNESTDDEGLGFDGLTRVLVEDAADLSRASAGDPLPEPALITLMELIADGDVYEGRLVRVEGLIKAQVDADTWVTAADKKAYVDVTDAEGNGPIKLRLSNGKNTGGYGEDPGAASFGVIGLLREDQHTLPETDGVTPVAYELWPRDAADILR